MTLASDRPPWPHPEGAQREVQRTLRVGVGGATGRVSRERSSRIGAVLALKAAGTLLRTKGKETYFLSKLARRWLSATPGWVPNITFSARQPE